MGRMNQLTGPLGGVSRHQVSLSADTIVELDILATARINIATSTNERKKKRRWINTARKEKKGKRKMETDRFPSQVDRTIPHFDNENKHKNFGHIVRTATFFYTNIICILCNPLIMEKKTPKNN